MRQFKFRGKRKDTGKWLFGDLVRNINGEFAIVPPFQMNMNNICSNYEVRPESIGQFTGFFDKNGKEIYEGDMLAWFYHDKNFITETIFFRDGCFMVRDTCCIGYISAMDTSLRVVIGNIHDGQKLLK